MDGFHAPSNTVYEIDGCFFHACSCILDCKSDDAKKQELAVKAERTQQKHAYIRQLCYNLVVMKECQWPQLKQKNERVQSAFQNAPSLHPGPLITSDILELVQTGKLSGILRDDIEIPEHLKEMFSEMCPIFKNVDISLDDVGHYMKQYGEEHGFIKQPQRSLISSYFGRDLLLINRLLQYYLRLGLKVTRIYKIVQFERKPCFKGFVEQVIQARREADLDTKKKVIAESMKTLVNSSYGKTVTNQTKFKTVSLCTEAEAKASVNDPRFISFTQLDSDIYEFKCSKQSICYDLPLYLVFLVFGYAKLVLLRFYFEFLDHFFSRRDFALIQCDTDSLYFSVSGESARRIQTVCV